MKHNVKYHINQQSCKYLVLLGYILLFLILPGLIGMYAPGVSNGDDPQGL